jgi:hypothetical protein
MPTINMSNREKSGMAFEKMILPLLNHIRAQFCISVFQFSVRPVLSTPHEKTLEAFCQRQNASKKNHHTTPPQTEICFVSEQGSFLDCRYKPAANGINSLTLWHRWLHSSIAHENL